VKQQKQAPTAIKFAIMKTWLDCEGALLQVEILGPHSSVQEVLSDETPNLQHLPNISPL
jgi:hypothetical protein